MNYYNENDPKMAAWLRALMAEGLIPQGEVDERSIADVRASDLRGFVQCHFFAGIGGWPLALQLAGWPEDRPVWTGSCPCQPFSCAGKGKGEEDHRHLWPEFGRLIRECRPECVIGEQVASAAGRLWLAGIQVDLEEMGFAVGAADLCSASVGAPNIRQRLYWVAESTNARQNGTRGGLPGQRREACGPADGSHNGGLGDDQRQRLAGRSVESNGEECQATERAGHELGFWSRYLWHPCSDRKQRRIPAEPSLFPLAPRLSGRVGLLRGAGNAINAQLAAEFIRCYLET